MKIVHTVESYPGKGGIATYLDDLAPMLCKAGCDVTIISKANGSSLPVPGGIPVIHVRDESEAVKRIDEKQPDIVHVHEWPAGEILKAFYGSFHPKIIIHHHGYGFTCPGYDLYWRRQKQVCQYGFGIKCILNAYLKHCQTSRTPKEILRSFRRIKCNLRYVQRGNLFIANSKYLKEKLVEHKIPKDKVVVLNYFTDIQQRFDIYPVSGRILFIGRVAESKGLDLLLKTVCQLSDDIDWSLVIAGNGYHMPKIRSAVEKMENRDRVEFTGWVDGETKSRLFHESSIVVVPSRWPEAFGIVGIEAMACARPVIAFDVGGISDWLRHEHTGYLIPPYDIHEMAKKIEWLLCNPVLANEMGKAGREEVKQRFLPEDHLNKLLRVYHEIAS